MVLSLESIWVNCKSLWFLIFNNMLNMKCYPPRGAAACSIVSGTRWLGCWRLGPWIHIWDYFWPKLIANKINLRWCDTGWLMFFFKVLSSEQDYRLWNLTLHFPHDWSGYSMIKLPPQANKISRYFHVSLKVWTDLNVTCGLSRSTWRGNKIGSPFSLKL